MPRECWAEELPRVAERICAAKPAMAGLRNAVGLLLSDLLVLGPDGDDAAAREIDLAADGRAQEGRRHGRGQRGGGARSRTLTSRRAATAPR